MPAHEGVSNDVLAERIEGVRAEVNELIEESKRTRTRLHQLEGFAGAYLDTQKANRRHEARQYRRLELRIQMLTLAVGFAAIASPIVVAILHGK